MLEFLNEEVLGLWVSGGFIMIPLAILGVVLYGLLAGVLLELRGSEFATTPADEWMHWVDQPREARGLVGEAVRYAQDAVVDEDQIRRRVEEIRAIHLPVYERLIALAAVLVGAAPLLGLLGTVAGMLSTFSGLSNGSGGATVDVVAGGISEALITTQTGLVLAIPGYVLLNAARRRLDRVALFFSQLEIATVQRFHRGRAAA